MLGIVAAVLLAQVPLDIQTWSTSAYQMPIAGGHTVVWVVPWKKGDVIDAIFVPQAAGWEWVIYVGGTRHLLGQAESKAEAQKVVERIVQPILRSREQKYLPPPATPAPSKSAVAQK